MRVPSPKTFTRLPTATPLRGPSGEGGTPEAFGAGLGESLARSGAATIALGNFVKEQEDKKVRFDALLGLSKFETQQAINFEQAKRSAPPGNSVFFTTVGENYKVAEKEFLSTLPPDLQAEFSVRTAEFGGRLSTQAMQFQYEQNDVFFKQGIQDQVDVSRISLGQDGSPENLERQRTTIDNAIAASGLTPAEQIAVQRKAYTGIEAVAYRQQQIQRLRDEQAGIGTDIDQATGMLEARGLDEGRAAEAAIVGQQIAQAALPRDAWAALPPRVRAALTSVAAVENGLAPEVIAAVSNGDYAELEDLLRESGHETEGDIINNPTATIDNDPAFSNVPYEDRLALLGDAEREVAAEISEQQKATKAANESLINALKVSLMDGGAGQADIDQLREMNVLTDYDDIKAAQDILDKRDEDLRLRQLGQQMMTGAVTFAPGNEEHAKILNSMVGTDGLAALDKKDSQYAANSFLPIVRQSGMVPSDAKDLISGMIRSQDSSRAYWALDLMQQIERASPKGYLAFNEDDRKSLDYWQARKDYVTEEEMVKGIRGPADPAERNAQIALRKQGQELFTSSTGPLKDFNPVTLFTGTPGWFFGMPNGINGPGSRGVEQQLNTDFQTLFLDNYQLYGDVEDAKAAAAKQLQRVWGATDVGADSKLMKYPPEKFYPPVGDNFGWMEQQLRDEGILLPEEQFELISDMQTENEIGVTAPSYVLAKHVDGRTEIQFNTDGSPMRVFFDFGLRQQEDEAAWREQQRKALELTDFQSLLGRAAKHSQDTGVPIPGAVLEENMPGGMVDAFMTEDPAAAAEADQRAQEFLFGREGDDATIETNGYRLP